MLVRAFCVAVAISQAIGGFGFFRQLDWAIDSWPLPDVRMTYIFLASIAAAIGAPCAWAAWRNELAVLRPIGFELMSGLPPLGGYLLWLAIDREDRTLAIAGAAFLGFAVVWALLYLWARHVPLKDARPLPGVFRLSFAGICILLVVLGSALLFQVADIFPWTISPEMSTVIGFVFLSAALLFGWIVAHPMWAFGEMALTSFLSYGLVLAGPYLDLWRNRNDEETVTSYYGGASYVAGVGDNGINEGKLLFYLAVLVFGVLLAAGIYAWGFVRRATMPGGALVGKH